MIDDCLDSEVALDFHDTAELAAMYAMRKGILLLFGIEGVKQRLGFGRMLLPDNLVEVQVWLNGAPLHYSVWSHHIDGRLTAMIEVLTDG